MPKLTLESLTAVAQHCYAQYVMTKANASPAFDKVELVEHV